MIDCIATYHENPLTCGVAKFNRILADQLGVPVFNLFDPRVLECQRPFLSIKCAEFSDHDLTRLHNLVQGFSSGVRLSLFLHGFDDTMTELQLINLAHKVYCGNREIYERLRPHVPSVVNLWSPSTLRPVSAHKSIGSITVFSFGMAHKLRANHYLRVRDLLQQSGRSYTVFLSAALHEGTSFEEAYAVSFDQLSKIFGDNVRFLGFLSDDAVLEYLQRATFFTAFFDKGVRENNSSVIAAMENGCVVITNFDNYSPTFFTHGDNILDIDRLVQLPDNNIALRLVSENARKSVERLAWPALIECLSKAR